MRWASISLLVAAVVIIIIMLFALVFVFTPELELKFAIELELVGQADPAPIQATYIDNVLGVVSKVGRNAQVDEHVMTEAKTSELDEQLKPVEVFRCLVGPT